MKTPELVIFDIDGLTLNTEYFWHKAWFTITSKHHHPEMYMVYRNMTGLSKEHTDRAMLENFPDLENREEIMAEARAYGHHLINTEVQTMPGAYELLSFLKETGIRTAVATNTSREATEKRLQQTGILHFFDDMICGDEVTQRKPDPEIYLKVLEKTGIHAENALVLEDSVYGVAAAYAAKIPVIMVPSLKAPGEEEEKKAYAIVPSLYNVIQLLLEK